MQAPFYPLLAIETLLYLTHFANKAKLFAPFSPRCQIRYKTCLYTHIYEIIKDLVLKAEGVDDQK